MQSKISQILQFLWRFQLNTDFKYFIYVGRVLKGEGGDTPPHRKINFYFKFKIRSPKYPIHFLKFYLGVVILLWKGDKMFHWIKASCNWLNCKTYYKQECIKASCVKMQDKRKSPHQIIIIIIFSLSIYTFCYLIFMEESTQNRRSKSF